jgi:hypothetical protein
MLGFSPLASGPIAGGSYFTLTSNTGNTFATITPVSAGGVQVVGASSLTFNTISPIVTAGIAVLAFSTNPLVAMSWASTAVEAVNITASATFNLNSSAIGNSPENGAVSSTFSSMDYTLEALLFGTETTVVESFDSFILDARLAEGIAGSAAGGFSLSGSGDAQALVAASSLLPLSLSSLSDGTVQILSVASGILDISTSSTGGIATDASGDLPPNKWTGLSRSALGLGWADIAQG